MKFLVVMAILIVKDVIEMELVQNVLMINIKVIIVTLHALIVLMVYAPKKAFVMIQMLIVKMMLPKKMIVRHLVIMNIPIVKNVIEMELV